ncbi:MAG: patatin-like phospholipase family protein [Elusimicrobiota bacterium]|jgi:NTE family protein|nr:patatin-like phospholipase family protein [Elusimicrobiota bacterium]
MKFKLVWLVLIFSLATSCAFAFNTEEDEILRDFLWREFTTLPKNERPKVGVAFSAGGTRGFSHIGVVEVLRESGLPIDYMAGTSMGCIVGSFFAADVPQERLMHFAQNPRLSYLSKDLTFVGVIKYVFKNSLFSSEKFEDFISDELGGLYYEDLPIPFACASADIKTGERVVFNSGPVALGVRASMNLPGIFAPVQYRQRYLVDGGVVDYMPIDLIKEMGAQWTLAVFALPDYSKTVPSTILGYIVRTGDLRGAVLMESSEKQANFLISARVGDINVMQTSEAERAMEIGAKTAFDALGPMKENLLLFGIDYVLK